MIRSSFARGRAAVALASSPSAAGLVVPPGIDGVVIRGTWRARVALGSPRMTIAGDADVVRSISVTHSGTTLTIVRSQTATPQATPELHVTLPRLRGVATSGAVHLTIEDRGASPLFLDLSGTGPVGATGAVPLLRVTTSGSVDANL
ncbi:MAG: DUF2807 domain-containing protein, partial [Candidatus Eremiobacteraeota bacterium]|nr:DUF2807 domain-containing protein [Candidatus Eremiobacteraeota bacterium]